MAIRTGSATSNGSFSNLSISGTTTKSGNITWTIPTLPDGATITSTILTATLTHSMTKGSATTTINGTSYTSSSSLNISLGTTTRSSLAVSSKGGNKNASGTVSISNITYTVNYQYDDGINEYTVTFVDWNGTVLKTQTVIEGESATPPSDPTRDGFVFTGWNGTYTNVTSNATITATYTEVVVPDKSTIRIGEHNVSKIFLGAINILRVYSGSQLIWGSTSSETGKPIYYGRLSISEVGGSVIQYDAITDTMIKSGTNINKITLQTLNRKSISKQSETSKGDYIIVAVPKNEGYIVKKDNDLGYKVMFDEDVSGANGNVALNIDGNEYEIYGEILISPAEIFIYIDKI